MGRDELILCIRGLKNIRETGQCQVAYEKQHTGRENMQNYREKTAGRQVLLVNDLAGYGKVALSAMIPVLSHMGHHIYNLPTALVSNTLDYGKFDILETTDYMRNTIRVWKELGFRFDAVSTGFIVSDVQAKMIAGFCREQRQDGAVIFVDPIMGDDGKLYNGITEQTVMHMKELVQVSDYMVPNYTEAVYLAGMRYDPEGMTMEETDELIGRLRKIGARSMVITSARVDHQDAVILYDHEADKKQLLPFTSIPVRFPGTGDIFSAVFMGKLLEGQTFADSTRKAMDAVSTLIDRNKDNEDKFKGIPLETCLEVLE